MEQSSQMISKLAKKAILIGLIAIITLSYGCTKKITSPSSRTPFVMKDYFPLHDGDKWIWETRTVNIISEPFGDNNYNGKWDEGEPFNDLDSNGVYSWFKQTSISRIKAGIGGTTSLASDGSVIFGRRSLPVGGPPGWSFVIFYTDDGFSNDGLGVRWHSHSVGNRFILHDDLKEHAPLTLAQAITLIGDTVINSDTLYDSTQNAIIFSWVSIFESVETVITPAGIFWYCLKFKTVASGWTGNMNKYNGTSYQWYARGVGLVKSEGPGEGEYWRLESATVGSKNYP
jgi:hypothetical protein